MRHAIIDKNNVVVNVVIWKGAEWLPPRDHMVVQADGVNVGDIYDPEMNTFTTPPRKEVRVKQEVLAE